MPADCYPCLRARAQVAALRGQDARAGFWFARAAAAAPTAPYAESEWGRALLDRKQTDAAIAHFAAASKIGPHFADPLEFWGEALMAKNQSHLALAKFEEGGKYAPNWGRLHLKWGEALIYAGKADEAKAQFARAAQLDLTPSEKAELDGQASGATMQIKTLPTLFPDGTCGASASNDRYWRKAVIRPRSAHGVLATQSGHSPSHWRPHEICYRRLSIQLGGSHDTLGPCIYWQLNQRTSRAGFPGISLLSTSADERAGSTSGTKPTGGHTTSVESWHKGLMLISR